MIVSLAEAKAYLGIGGITYPAVSVDMTIDTTAGTITRASGDWDTDKVKSGSLLTLAGFTNGGNNVEIAVTEVTSPTVIKYLGPAGMLDEGGTGTSFDQADPADDTTYDTFLTEQLQLLSDTVEGYCGRKFEAADYVQTYYSADYLESSKYLLTYHYPIVTLTEIKKDAEVFSTATRVHKPTGRITCDLDTLISSAYDEVEVTYRAGYESADMPKTVKSVILNLVEERYNKKNSGVGLNFGSDVQRISIPGAISIDFDYTLSSNERKSSYGVILGSQANVLDPYRSERTLGLGDISYVA